MMARIKTVSEQTVHQHENSATMLTYACRKPLTGLGKTKFCEADPKI